MKKVNKFTDSGNFPTDTRGKILQQYHQPSLRTQEAPQKLKTNKEHGRNILEGGTLMRIWKKLKLSYHTNIFSQYN